MTFQKFNSFHIIYLFWYVWEIPSLYTHYCSQALVGLHSSAQPQVRVWRPCTHSTNHMYIQHVADLMSKYNNLVVMLIVVARRWTANTILLSNTAFHFHSSPGPRYDDDLPKIFWSFKVTSQVGKKTAAECSALHYHSRALVGLPFQCTTTSEGWRPCTYPTTCD